MTQPNAIDVTKIRENQLLEHLGKTDWVIVLPEGLPHLIVMEEWRFGLQAYAGKLFARWVMDGVDRVFTHDYDPPWDHSGSLRSVITDSLTLLTRHASLSDWAENEYTGYSEATFESGIGLSWITYYEEIRDYVERQMTDFVSAHCMDFWKIEDESNLFEDKRWDFSEIPIIVSILAFASLKDTLKLLTTDAWKWFETDIHTENAARRKEAERRHYMQEQVKRFWGLHFPDLMSIRIEMPLFRKMGLEKRITDVLADADPDIVQAIVEIYVPGNYSNTVRECIQYIARRAIT